MKNQQRNEILEFKEDEDLLWPPEDEPFVEPPRPWSDFGLMGAILWYRVRKKKEKDEQKRSKKG